MRARNAERAGGKKDIHNVLYVLLIQQRGIGCFARNQVKVVLKQCLSLSLSRHNFFCLGALYVALFIERHLRGENSLDRLQPCRGGV